ncbi:PREDICTED: putative axial regulator YABBY 2 [Tarenaya hassleriana]|uniref:putative axial regulator YABBY 2 n=1 Tax=Tarenaya hassleriana TaxID=28532 RepID=UPI00053C0A9C|nr:PREDICTED: putative axial regulator YABBY 2 [Tarenaya hassleriana]
MSLDLSSERVCYVSCNFCNTILAVNVPYASLFTIVTVRCGHCTNLLSLNMGASLHQISPPVHQDLQFHKQHITITSPEPRKECGSSSKSTISSTTSSFESVDREAPRMPPIRPPPEKRQRVPSAYNRFIKEEIQRIKASNPEISHREAFSTAAKNWAHFPHIHFGLKLDGNKQGKQLDQAVAGQKL